MVELRCDGRAETTGTYVVPYQVQMFPAMRAPVPHKYRLTIIRPASQRIELWHVLYTPRGLTGCDVQEPDGGRVAASARPA